MSEPRIFMGQFTPSHNVRCQVTGKAFGPTLPKKVGYKVTVEHDGKRDTFITYGRGEAMQIRERAEQASEGDM